MISLRLAYCLGLLLGLFLWVGVGLVAFGFFYGLAYAFLADGVWMGRGNYHCLYFKWWPIGIIRPRWPAFLKIVPNTEAKQ